MTIRQLVEAEMASDARQTRDVAELTRIYRKPVVASEPSFYRPLTPVSPVRWQHLRAVSPNKGMVVPAREPAAPAIPERRREPRFNLS